MALSPEQLADALARAAGGLALAPRQVSGLHADLAPAVPVSERSQVLQESKLWDLPDLSAIGTPDTTAAGSSSSPFSSSPSAAADATADESVSEAVLGHWVGGAKVGGWVGSRSAVTRGAGSPARAMADALDAEAFPRPKSARSRRRRARKKASGGSGGETRQKGGATKTATAMAAPQGRYGPQTGSWSIRQPRGDLIKGLDGLTEVEAMKLWKEALGPQSFRLGKAKAAIQLYQKCVGEQELVHKLLVGDLDRERDEHNQTHRKLVAQEELFADLLSRCARTANAGRLGKMTHTPNDALVVAAAVRRGGGAEGEDVSKDGDAAEEKEDAGGVAEGDTDSARMPPPDGIDTEVRTKLLVAAASTAEGDIDSVIAAARGVSAEYLGRVQTCIDIKTHRQLELEAELRRVNRDLQQAVTRNNELRLQLDRMSAEGQRLQQRVTTLSESEARLLQRCVQAEQRAAKERRRRLKAEDVLAGQSGEVSAFVHSVLDSCQKHFGYVPPGVKKVSVFLSPRVVQIPR